MVLVKREHNIRLISIRYDPWATDQENDNSGTLELEVSSKKQKSDGEVFVFSGAL